MDRDGLAGERLHEERRQPLRDGRRHRVLDALAEHLRVHVAVTLEGAAVQRADAHRVVDDDDRHGRESTRGPNAALPRSQAVRRRRAGSSAPGVHLVLDRQIPARPVGDGAADRAGLYRLRHGETRGSHDRRHGRRLGARARDVRGVRRRGRARRRRRRAARAAARRRRADRAPDRRGRRCRALRRGRRHARRRHRPADRGCAGARRRPSRRHGQQRDGRRARTRRACSRPARPTGTSSSTSGCAGRSSAAGERCGRC